MPRPRVLKWINIKCPCGIVFETWRPERAKYHNKKCFYIYRNRPKGLKYKIVAINKGWYKFKGGFINKKGYRIVNRRLEHVIIMENILGRRLNKNEVVHHLNGNKTDNRIENLSLISKKEHDNYHLLRRFL